MKKQGPPPSLNELNASLKRKAGEPETQKWSSNKRRRGENKTAVQAIQPKANGKTKKPFLKNADAQTVPVPRGVPRPVEPARDIRL